MKILFAMIYPPDKGGSGAPIYSQHLLNSLWQDQKIKSGIVFSTHETYKNVPNENFIKYPLYFTNPPIFDSQPKIAYSIPFKDMNSVQIEHYIDTFYKFFCLVGPNNKYNYDVIHVQHGMYIGYAAAEAKKITKIPYIITLHIMELNFLAEFPDPILALKAVVEADKIIALTKAQKQRLIDEYSPERIIKLESRQKGISLTEARKRFKQIVGKKINSRKIVVCPLGIDTNLFKPIPKIHVDQRIKLLWPKIPSDGKFVMYAGRLIAMKGILTLLEAEKKYNKNNDIITIIAGGGNLEPDVKRIIQNRHNIYYLGFIEQSEMPYLHNFVAQRKGVFTVPSSSEGLSLVYLEAMNCGTPVIYCCKKDMAELDFMQPPNASLIPFNDSDKLAQTILNRLNRESNRNLKKNLKKSNKYNLYNMFRSVKKVYQNIIKQNN